MNTIWTGTSAYGLQLTYIDNRNYPGGILGFLAVEFSLAPNVLSLAAFVAGNILADGLLVGSTSTLLLLSLRLTILKLWRCQVIWTASMGRKANYFMILPGLVLLASIGTLGFRSYLTFLRCHQLNGLLSQLWHPFMASRLHPPPPVSSL